ncbi:MAG TPA: HEAT repeat domain-containing protein [candidate division WOR-3 bacterium]|uniref:HEAT repeat domain-containing protein n=1 Tax=candidate division WOR-3 bacterium TaxID=2052148 RepID=A0A9C9K047_UNCW3|nr:HEAT repeat domain-containing protein [candidate division WOR-3 bacterium]
MKIRFKQDKKTILKLLETSGIKRRLRILDRLNGVNEKDSINILLKVLEDNSWVMREKAAYKLAEYGNRVVQRLIRLLKRGFWYTRAAACLTLGEIGNIKALEAIVTLILDDDNPTVIKEASSALLKLARKEPVLFADGLKNLSLIQEKKKEILKIIEDAEPELYTVIMKELENE